MLPLHKRYFFHKRVGIDLRSKVRLTVVAAVVGLLVAAGEEYLFEYNLRLTSENQVLDLVAHGLRPPMGAPGTIRSDFEEGTTELPKLEVNWGKK